MHDDTSTPDPAPATAPSSAPAPDASGLPAAMPPINPAAYAGRVLKYDELMAAQPRVDAELHIGHLIASSVEAAQHIEVEADVYVPGLRDPQTGKFGMVARVRKLSPDQEALLWAKSREKAVPEEAAKYLQADHLPALGRAFRFEQLWKLVYGCVRPVITFDWAQKIYSLPYGGEIVNPLTAKIDELSAIRHPIDVLTDNNIFAYPSLFGEMKIAARDGKLSEWFGSIDKGVAQTVRDNARTMFMVQMAVLREDAELRAYLAAVIADLYKRGEYDVPGFITETLEMLDPERVARRSAPQTDAPNEPWE